MKKVAPYAKALIGAGVAGLGAAGTALTDGSISPAEWVAIASATLVALGSVWAMPNAAGDVEPDEPAGGVAPKVFGEGH